VEKERYTQEEMDYAKSQHVGRFLESRGLAKREGSGYRGIGGFLKSLYVKPDGAWFLNDGAGAGNNPVELVKRHIMHEEGYPEKEALIKAVKRLAGTEGTFQPTQQPTPKPITSTPKPPITLPEKSNHTQPIYDYLCKKRGLDPQIIEDCVYRGQIFRTKEYGSIAFVSSDKEGTPKHVFIRGTSTSPEKQFKQDLVGSDKSFPFVLEGKAGATSVHVFESSIDVLSHASLYKLNGQPIDSVHRISLHGTSFGALKTFLADYPQVKEIVPCLDNDTVGKRRTEKMIVEFDGKDGIKVLKPKPPTTGKDFNEMLLHDDKYGLKKFTQAQGVQVARPIEVDTSIALEAQA